MLPILAAEGIVGTVAKLIDGLHTSDKERLDAEIELRKLGIEEAKIEAELVAGQQEINKTEAQHSSIFVAGWRPAIGWVGAISLAYQFVLYPFMVWGWTWLQANGWISESLAPPPVLDAEVLWVIITGMLGIAGARTFEKIRGVAR